MFKPIRQDTQSESLRLGYGFNTRRTIAHNAGQFWNLRNPATVFFLLNLESEGLHC